MRRNALSLLFSLTAALLLSGCNGTDAETEIARPVMVVQPGAAADSVTAFAGEVRARHEPALSFRIGGKISRRLVDVGARVQAGQPLAELDAADVGLQVESARAQLASAEADLALAKNERDRYRSLLDQQLVSKSLFDSRESQYQAALARVRQTRAQAQVSGNQASYAVLRAPVSGVIAQRLAESGQVVAAGQTVFVLAQDGEREVAISVPEHLASEFVPGRKLAVELWAEAGKRVVGSLREISPAADAASRTYAARVSFDAGQMPVELGQSARVYARADEAVGMSLPLSAIHAKDGQPAVWRIDPASSRVRLVPVQIGGYTESMVPVLGGLQPGDWVAMAGVHLLREGQLVQPVDRANRPVPIAAAAPTAAAAR